MVGFVLLCSAGTTAVAHDKKTNLVRKYIRLQTTAASCSGGTANKGHISAGLVGNKKLNTDRFPLFPVPSKFNKERYPLYCTSKKEAIFQLFVKAHVNRCSCIVVNYKPQGKLPRAL